MESIPCPESAGILQVLQMPSKGYAHAIDIWCQECESKNNIVHLTKQSNMRVRLHDYRTM